GLGALAMDTGAMTVFLYCFTQRETIYNLIEALTGARFTTSYTRIGGLANDMPEDFIPMLRTFLEQFPATIDEVDKLLTRNKIFIERNREIGVLTKEDAVDLGVTGPILRGSGVEWDIRKAHPYSSYEDFDFEIPIGTVGDAYDRYLVRMEEMRQSNRIVRQCIDWLRVNPGPVIIENHKIAPPSRVEMKGGMEQLIHHFKLVTEGMHVPEGEVYAAVEAPKGEFGVYLVSDGTNRPYRCKIRAPSFAHLAAMDFLCRGHMLADVSAVLGSIDIVFGEIDR
ncbi:MAG: NADH-quinone oxidoreductase subunit D, partial [Burkholderiales bacterium]